MFAVADGMYGVYQPYDDPGDDLLSQTAQLSIFFSLVASIVTNAYPNDPVMSALLPLFLAVPIAFMILFELELLTKFKELMKPDEEGNVKCIGRVMLHVGHRAISQIERMCGTTGSGDAGKIERDERLKVLVSVKALRRRSSARWETSMRKGSTTRPGLSKDLHAAVGSPPEAAPNEGATNAPATAEEVPAMDPQARRRKGSKAANEHAVQVEMVSHRTTEGQVSV